jgi:aldehyde dehydrogenase (NAD+)
MNKKITSSEILKAQKSFFETDKTKEITYRTTKLRKLKKVLQENEDVLYEAIYKDFSKSQFDTFITELSQVYEEINIAIKNVNKWSGRKRVSTNLANIPARSYIIPEPLGCTLIISAWNYPYYLSLAPMIAAMAAGNTVILKPSELSTETSKILAQIINTHFSHEYLYVYEGGVAETTEILTHRFDKIFFTGSTEVGKIVYAAAAKHLSPVTLELGGKSPTFVLADCDIQLSAKRIVWAKFVNAGQTCVAPDYILVDKAIKEKFLIAVKNEIIERYPRSEAIQENYTQIINSKNFKRILSLIDWDKVYHGGEVNVDKRYISPTVIDNVGYGDAIMQQEIFGPVLPIISFDDLDEAILQVKKQHKPLALYIYARNRQNIDKILRRISFGGGTVNDSVMHLTNSNLPFGGVGMSGIGSYHGKAGFDSFSHFKSILHRSFWFEPNLKYFPYTKEKFSFLKWLFK